MKLFLTGAILGYGNRVWVHWNWSSFIDDAFSKDLNLQIEAVIRFFDFLSIWGGCDKIIPSETKERKDVHIKSWELNPDASLESLQKSISAYLTALGETFTFCSVEEWIKLENEVES